MQFIQGKLFELSDTYNITLSVLTKIIRYVDSYEKAEEILSDLQRTCDNCKDKCKLQDISGKCYLWQPKEGNYPWNQKG